MTPYIVTHCQYVQDARPWTDVKSRRAVATLEEAKRAIWESEAVGPMPFGVLMAQLGALSESGGTVGPLPDGTVIEVERVTWAALGGRILGRGYRPESELLAAFNARQLA